MSTIDLSGTRWRKSTRSGNGGDCIEVASRHHVVAVRDSKDRSGPTLIFTHSQWRTLIADVQSGRAGGLA